MTHKIFLSHKWEDKPVVEPVALRLREIFGEDGVFYDSWSIGPGDGIIEKMDQGLTAPEFVFFFVSKLSLTSGLVKLEWQNALLKASKGQTRLIPVRIDDVVMPEVLRQSLYIDVYSVGLEAGLNQIVNVVQGNASFTPQHVGFSNLTMDPHADTSGVLTVTISASHLMEPNPNFILVMDNAEPDLTVGLWGGAPCLTKYYPAPFGEQFGNGWTIAPMGGAITPERPMKVIVTPTDPARPIKLKGLMHGWSAPFREVPIKS
jgi:hypothetical protein